MMNYPIDGALAAAESAFEIDLLNKVIGTTYPQAAVYGTNTLGQVLQEYAIDIGVNPHDSKIHFENKRTGASTSDTNETVEGLGLQCWQSATTQAWLPMRMPLRLISSTR